MTLFNRYSVEYFAGSTWTTLPNLVSITCNVGRKSVTEDTPTSTAQFTFRYPTGFASPNNDIKVGVPIRFKSPNGDAAGSWSGYIRDATVQWGKPYTAGVGNDDYLIIDAEGALARWGRIIGDGFTPIGNTGNSAITEAGNYYGLTWNGDVTSQPVKQTATNGNLLDWLNTVVRTVDGRVLDGFPASALTDANRRGNVRIESNANTRTSTVNLSDTLNNATNMRYTELLFDGLAENFYDRIVVTAPTFTDQVAQTGAGPYRSWQYDTFADSTAQMQQIGSYLLAVSQGQAIAPSAVTVSSLGQVNPVVDVLSGNTFCRIPGFFINITFRGTTYLARIEGASLAAYPDQTRVTYYLSPQAFNNWLILDNATLGKLDSNRLALYQY